MVFSSFVADKLSSDEDKKSILMEEVKKALLLRKLDEPYPMNKNGKHGYALIINIIQIDGRERRLGAESDSIKLAAAVKTLGYDLVGGTVHENCTAFRIKELFKEAMSLDHTQNDSFICCLNSHGDSGYIYGSDDHFVYLADLREQAVECKSLVGKPKLFFIHSSRGGYLPDAQEIESDPDTFSLPHGCDVLFSYSTTPNAKACRFTNEGSWFVTELCRAIDQYPSADLMTILEKAHFNVNTNEEYVYTRPEDGTIRTFKQSPELVSSLNRKVYF